MAGLIVFVLKFLFIYDRLLRYRERREERKNLEKLTRKEISELETRQKELNYTLPENPLSGKHPVSDEKGLVSNVNVVEELRIFP